MREIGDKYEASSEIQEQFTLAKCLISSVQEAIKEVDHMIKEVAQNGRETMSQVRSAAECLIDAIRQYEGRTILHVRQVTDAKKQLLQLQKQNLCELLEDCQSTVEYTQKALAHPVVEEVAMWEDALLKQLQELNSSCNEFQPVEQSFMEFDFMYEDPKLLSSFCSFGQVITTDTRAHGQDVNMNYEQTNRKVDSSRELINGRKNLPIIQINGCEVDIQDSGSFVSASGQLSTLL